MKISHIAWSKSGQLVCVGCGSKTTWQDGVCNKCTIKAPNYVPYEQMRKFYLLKRRKNA